MGNGISPGALNGLFLAKPPLKAEQEKQALLLQGYKDGSQINKTGGKTLMGGTLSLEKIGKQLLGN